jgi:HEAT repeat protein
VDSGTLSPDQLDLMTRFAQGDFQTRWEVSKQLLRLGSKIIAPLTQLLHEAGAVQSHPDVDPDAATPAEPDHELEWFIAHTLAELEHPTAIAPLSQLLSHAEADVRLQAANALARLGTVTLPILQEHLAHPNTRLLAVQILSQIDDDQVLPLLIDEASDADPQVRATALSALGSFVTLQRLPQVLPIGLAALQDPVASVRSAAINLLGRGATVAAPDTPPDTPPESSPAHHWQIQADELVQKLFPSLWDISLDVTQQAALTLGRIGTSMATQALQERLQDAAEPALLLKIVQALVWIASPAALQVLEQTLNVITYPTVQQEIITGLGRLPEPLHPQATEILLNLIDQDLAQDISGLTPVLQQAIVHSLGRLGQPAAIDRLIRLLAQPHTGVQFHIIAALKQLNPDLSYQRLQAKAQEPNLPNRLQQGLLLALKEW